MSKEKKLRLKVYQKNYRDSKKNQRKSLNLVINILIK